MSIEVSRRSFLKTTALAAGAAMLPAGVAAAQRRASPLEQYPDLRRHFLFEYYPWYRTDPWDHWNEGGRVPPGEIGSNYMPALGAYDSRSVATLEQHARWIADSGAGGIDVSWWGPDSNENRAVPLLMDVMAAHDLHVAFYVEPYHERHAETYASDLMYLIRNYGDRRRWDCFLLLEHADGSVGPVFKSFRTILLPTSRDCHGVVSAVSDYAADDVWRRQTDAVRETLKDDFDRLTLLADSSEVNRTRAGGFDGIALFDNYVSPELWSLHARNCNSHDLVFSFQINPGFDGIVPRVIPPDGCYSPPPFAPGGGVYDWTRASDRAAAAEASRARVVDSFNRTVTLQTAPESSNRKHGFFLAYINSFNEWHEGHAFEPMRDWDRLTSAERAQVYHNPDDGAYRLNTLSALIHGVVD